MALAINDEKEHSMGNVTVDRRLYLTADKSKVVEDGDPKAAFLWAIRGRNVSEEEAKRVGYKPKPATAKAASGDDDRPAKSASKADWVEHAVAQGADREAADAATKDDLVNAEDYTVFTADNGGD